MGPEAVIASPSMCGWEETFPPCCGNAAVASVHAVLTLGLIIVVIKKIRRSRGPKGIALLGVGGIYK